MKCHYEVLEVEQRATDDELKKAYRKLALRWHPDKNPDNLEEAKVQFQVIQAAYDTLSDPQERAFYDRHRESIIMGKASGSDPKPDDINLFAYFTSTCYSGFDDSEKGFYTVYRRLFEKIACKDMQYMDDSEHDIIIPNFGASDADHEDVAQFYGYWTAYCTSVSFAWVDEYDIREAQGMGRFIGRKIEQENKKARLKARKQFNEEVRSLVAFVKKRDKRWAERKKVLEAKAAENAEKQRLAQERQLKERQRRLQESFEQEKEKIAAYEKELEAMERQFADEWGITDSEESEEYDDDEVDVEVAEVPDGADIDVENGLDDDEFLYDHLYCVACDKEFKSENAMESHNRSKKHKENLAKMKATILAEDELLNEGEEQKQASKQASDSSCEEEEVIEPSKSSKKKKKKKKKNLAEESTPPAVVEVQSSKRKKGKKNKRQILDFDESSDSDKDLQEKHKGDGKSQEKHKAEGNNSQEDKEESGEAFENGLEDNVEDEDAVVPGKAKLKGKKAKDAKKQARQAEAETEATQADKKDAVCSVCKSVFASRSKLFAHIKAEGHAALKTAAPHASKKAKSKTKS